MPELGVRAVIRDAWEFFRRVFPMCHSLMLRVFRQPGGMQMRASRVRGVGESEVPGEFFGIGSQGPDGSLVETGLSHWMRKVLFSLCGRRLISPHQMIAFCGFSHGPRVPITSFTSRVSRLMAGMQ